MAPSHLSVMRSGMAVGAPAVLTGSGGWMAVAVGVGLMRPWRPSLRGDYPVVC